jgi:hypothetical protein
MFKYSIDGSIVPDTLNKEKVIMNSNVADCVYNVSGNFSCTNKETFYVETPAPATKATTAPTTTTTAPTTTTTAPATTTPTPATKGVASGSYSKTCYDDILSKDGLTLTSTCRKPDGNILTTSKMCSNKSWDNIDGNLMCTPDGNAWVPLVIVAVLGILFLAIAHFGNIPPAPKSA